MLCAPSPSQRSDSKNPKKHQADNAVSKKKSAIMDRSDKNTRLSDIRLNANRGIRTGAPKARTSKACSAGANKPVRKPCILRNRYTT